MELLDLRVGGVAIGTLLGIWGAWYLINGALKDWGEQRALNRELEEADRAFKAKYRWEPDMHSGVDMGKWVRKDGLPDYDDG